MVGSNSVLQGMFRAYIIAHPNDPRHAEETQAHCVAVGLPQPTLVRGLKPTSGAVSAANQSITAVHLRVLATAIRHGCEHRHQHVLVMEDDCRFLGRMTGRIEDIVGGLHDNWTSIHLGHVPLGPCIPITVRGRDMVVWSSLPFTGHAYLLHYRKLRSIMAHWGERPFSHEGMLSSSFWGRFAIYPPLATQNRRPKELAWIDKKFKITSVLDFHQWTHVTCLVSFLLPVLIAYVLLSFTS
jgi:hypothetical protein